MTVYGGMVEALYWHYLNYLRVFFTVLHYYYLGIVWYDIMVLFGYSMVLLFGNVRWHYFDSVLQYLAPFSIII